MVKCPFCQYDNEDGALFCEQCKSDLGAVEPVPVAPPMAAEVIPAEPVMAAAVLDETLPITHSADPPPVAFAEAVSPPPSAGPPLEPTIPMAEPVIETMPVDLAPSEPPPAAAESAAAPPAFETVTNGPAASVAPPPAAAPAAAPATPGQLPPDAHPRLVVLRGQKINVEYPLYEGHNFIGRADEKPVDIDLDDQEPPDRIWSSRQHALVTYENGGLVIEDLNSSNGTFVNRTRVYPGQKRPLSVGDVIQIGTVQMKVKV
jgi:hypothetical protein